MLLKYLKTHHILHSLDLRIDKCHVIDKSWLMQESPCLKPDWFEDMKSFPIKNECISLYIRRSNFFPKIGRNETGR